jgi:choline dehydrogenase-like flavoprotein
MASTVFDVVVVGGGVAGSSLGAALARAGLEVLVVEREARFRDRVRGDSLFPWGVVEMTWLTSSPHRARAPFPGGRCTKTEHLASRMTGGRTCQPATSSGA